jgi:hypothetical protein
VAFVGVKDGRLNSKGSQNANTADSQNDFLADAMFFVAAVKPGRQLAVAGFVLVDVGIHEVKRHRTEIHPPNNDKHAQVSDLQLDQEFLFVFRARRFNGRFPPIQQSVNVLLPAVGMNALMKVSLRINEADTDERNPQVARFLAVVAG